MVAVVRPLGPAAAPFKVQCRNHYLGVNLEGNYASLIIHYIARLLLLLFLLAETRRLNEFLAGEAPKGCCEIEYDERREDLLNDRHSNGSEYSPEPRHFLTPRRT